MGRRNQFAGIVSAAFESSDLGWHRNPLDVPGAPASHNYRFPSVPLVNDGPTDAGRGTTLFDVVRRAAVAPGVVRFDWLSIKTASQEAGGKVPTKFSLCTGLPETIDGVVEGCNAGASYPTVFVIKANDGGALWICADLAPVVRKYGIVGIEDRPDSGYDRGAAPPLYVKWSGKRPSGVKRHQRLIDAGIPVRMDERIEGGILVGPGYLKYPELCISLSSLGVNRSSWGWVRSVAQIPALLDTADGFASEWEGMGG